MSRKLLIAVCALALAAFGFAACGGDDEDDGDTGTVATETTETTDEEPAGNGAAGGGGDTLEIGADPGGALEYTTGSLDAAAGEVEIVFDNPSGTPHDVRIESEDGEDLGGTEVITSDSATATVELEPGTYTYFCSVAGHREAGMEDTLTVE
jgi:plastocyanin